MNLHKVVIYVLWCIMCNYWLLLKFSHMFPPCSFHLLLKPFLKPTLSTNSADSPAGGQIGLVAFNIQTVRCAFGTRSSFGCLKPAFVICPSIYLSIYEPNWIESNLIYLCIYIYIYTRKYSFSGPSSIKTTDQSHVETWGTYSDYMVSNCDAPQKVGSSEVSSSWLSRFFS